jgi:alkanesulfonate monooxygenase SsuD/methylene tetrahydromethanopterin reductase-like flavin-dependent oxidoreductase (luciferase family)
MMRTFEVGLVLPVGEPFGGGAVANWANIRDLARRAEEMGFDVVWTSDELLWRPANREAQGWWEGVSMAAAIAAVTSRIKVGTWILSALHRNPGITAKAVETIDEISGGRFVFGLGAGHAGQQAHAFGLPEDHVVARFEEAIQIIVPLLRQGRANVDGTFHAARDLEHRPVGPRPGRIPIMIGAKGPRMLRIAALHADIWSWFVEERSEVADFAPKLAALHAACVEVGRDPATIRKSAGIIVEPTDVGGSETDFGIPIRGSADEIAEALRSFASAGFTNVEVLVWPPSPATLDAMAPVLERLEDG